MAQDSLYRLLVLLAVSAACSGCKYLDERVESDVGEPTLSEGSPPTIWGTPETSVVVGSQYFFAPEFEDPDGDVLAFEIVNKPEWAAFDSFSGQLQGVPTSNDVGVDADIVISVSDQTSIASLPAFSITVESADSPGDGDSGDDGGDSGDDGGAGSSSTPPTISGQPNQSVVVDTMYSFQPEASDPDGDPLSFSIVNKPVWAGFNTDTGRLQGTPGNDDVGETEGIDISVTDGTSIASLGAFSITVVPSGPLSYTVSWAAPALNVDGTPLTDLAGYRIYYGTASGQYSETIELSSPGLTSYQIENLSTGAYFLVMTSVNSEGAESAYSGELRFDVGG